MICNGSSTHKRYKAKDSKELAEAQKLDVEIIQTVLTNSEYILSPTTGAFAKAHQEQADFLYSVGGIDKKLETSKVILNKFVEKALDATKEN